MGTNQQSATERKPVSRREFVRVLTTATALGPGAVAAGLGGFSLTHSQRAEAAEAMAQGLGKLPRRKLGTRMGNMMVTPVCICSDWNRELVAPGLALGINFIHKAGYWREVPDEVKKLPRDSYYTDFTVDSTPDNPDDEDRAYNQITSTLERTGFRYYDIMRAHFGWRSVDAFKNQTGTYKAFQRLKREGKVRFFGVSQHASPWDGPRWPTYPDIMEAEIKSGIIDSMQVWFSYGWPKEVEDAFAAASRAGIGMTAMKVFATGHNRMAADPAMMASLKAGDKVGRACIRYVMTKKRDGGKPLFNTCVSNLQNMDTFEENIGGVSPKVALLDGFGDLNA